MAREQVGSQGWRGATVTALVVMAFLSPGAWFVLRLPPVPVAKALHLATAGIWLLAAGLALVPLARLDRRVAAALGLVAAVTAVSWLAHGSLFAVAFYDLFANMPLVQWAAFPAVFTVAACLAVGRESVERALAATVALGGVLGVVMTYQFFTTAPQVFGSTGYSLTALAPLVPVGAVLAAGATGRTRALFALASAAVLLALGAFSGALMGALVAVLTVLVTVAALAAGRGGAAEGGAPRAARGAVRTVALGVAGLMFAVMLLAQVPAISGGVAGPERLEEAGAGLSFVSRAHMWAGAQAMFADRPLLGFGPSGYRVAAVEYLPPQALQFIPDRPDSIDPTVYSPQSPHSLLWEIATRLGLVGLIAFGALFAAWAVALRDAPRPDAGTARLRAGLAAGFVAALFSLQVNPVLFPMGLVVPALAGLAVAPLGPDVPARAPRADGPAGTGRWTGARIALVASGAVLAGAALWLGVGEWRAETGRSSDPFEQIALHERTLAALPGHPQIERELAELRLLVAPDAPSVAAAQAAADALPAHVARFAPNLVSLATYSLAQAERTGRDDLSWEDARLSHAEEVLPPTPALVAERLHLAVLSGDVAAVEAALPAAREWGGFYPFTEAYLTAAEQLLSASD